MKGGRDKRRRKRKAHTCYALALPPYGGPDGERSFESVPPASPAASAVRDLPQGLFYLLPQALPPWPNAQPTTTGRQYVGPGHPPYTPPKLTAAEREQVLTRLRAGEPYRAIASAVGVSRQTIARIAQAAREEGVL
jgi:hypothetical protein